MFNNKSCYDFDRSYHMRMLYCSELSTANLQNTANFHFVFYVAKKELSLDK